MWLCRCPPEKWLLFPFSNRTRQNGASVSRTPHREDHSSQVAKSNGKSLLRSRLPVTSVASSSASESLPAAEVFNSLYAMVDSVNIAGAVGERR